MTEPLSTDYRRELAELTRERYNDRLLDRLGSIVFEAVLTGLLAILVGGVFFLISPVAGLCVWAGTVSSVLILLMLRISTFTKSFATWRPSPEMPLVRGKTGLVARTARQTVLGGFTLNLLSVSVLAAGFVRLVPIVDNTVFSIALGLAAVFLYLGLFFRLWQKLEAELRRHDFAERVEA